MSMFHVPNADKVVEWIIEHGGIAQKRAVVNRILFTQVLSENLHEEITVQCRLLPVCTIPLPIFTLKLVNIVDCTLSKHTVCMRLHTPTLGCLCCQQCNPSCCSHCRLTSNATCAYGRCCDISTCQVLLDLSSITCTHRVDQRFNTVCLYYDHLPTNCALIHSRVN